MMSPKYIKINVESHTIKCYLEESVEFSLTFLLSEVPEVAEIGNDEGLKFWVLADIHLQ